MYRQATLSFAVLVASTVGSSAFAHHSYAQYDRCQSVSIEGQIQHIAWANPHVVLTLARGDSDPYRIEWWDLQRLTRLAIPADSLNVGDRIVVTGSTNRDPSLKIMTLLTEIRRPIDGWNWMRPGDLPKVCQR